MTQKQLIAALRACTCLKACQVKQVITALKCIVNEQIEETGTSQALLVLVGRSKERKKIHGVILDEF